jgi:hypothetical protein
MASGRLLELINGLRETSLAQAVCHRVNVDVFRQLRSTRCIAAVIAARRSAD